MQKGLMFRRTLSGATIAALMLGSVAAEAHGIWFAQRAKQLALIYGIGSDDLDMVKRLPQVESVTAYDAEYLPIKATARIAGPIVLIDADAQPTLVAAVMPYGVWSRVGEAEFEKKTLYGHCPRTDWRLRPCHAVELAALPDHRQSRAGAGRWLHGGAQTQRTVAAQRAAVCPGDRGSGLAGRRVQSGQRQRQRSGRCYVAPPRYRHDLDHRIHPRGHSGVPGGGGNRQARRAGTGGQVAEHRAARCRS